jgi:ATP-dependent DNA ligase
MKQCWTVKWPRSTKMPPFVQPAAELRISRSPAGYFVFDLLIRKGQNVMTKPLSEPRALLESEVLPKLAEPIRYSAAVEANLSDLIASVK